MEIHRILSACALAGSPLTVGACYTGSAIEPSGASTSSTAAEDEGEDGGQAGDDDTGAEDPVPEICNGDALNAEGSVLLRRLTAREYANAVSDVLGADISERLEDLPRDIRSVGFTNTASALIASYEHIEEWERIARDVAEGVDSDTLRAFAPCDEPADQCYRGFVDELGLRLFRRPLDARAQGHFSDLFHVVEDEGGSFEEGARLALQAFLQSPQFLYRVESTAGSASAGNIFNVDGYELASRLSFLIWESAPDDVLLELADAGTLNSADQIRSEVERMLASPKARRSAQRFARDWLGLDELDGVSRDPERYAEFTASMKEAMVKETLDVYERIVWDDDAPLIDLLTTEHTIASPEIAELYGLEVSSTGEEYDLSSLGNRQGILTHPSMLTLTAHGDTPSVVGRGLFIFENVLCKTVAQPPVDVDDTPPASEPGRTQRSYSEERRAEPACSCHSVFDPFAYALEVFDGVGAFSPVDHLGNELRSDGSYPGADGLEFENARELMDLLADDPAVETCFAKKHLQFAIGRPLSDADECVVEEIADAFEDGGGTYRAMILAIATHPSFLVKISE